ncbi:MAG: integrase [Clostridiales bacterium]|nr:integrase [Clostridiales bacterium]
MADSAAYRDQIDAKRILQIRAITRELPQACSDFIRSIAVTTGTFTRLAYAIDLRTFFHFLQTERVAFSEKNLTIWSDEDLSRVSQSDLTAYIEYLTYYFKTDDELNEQPVKALVNHDLAIKRKLCSIRSFYDFLFKNHRIPSNVTLLVPLPKIHEKPILRLTRDEMSKMLSQAETGEGMTEGQKRYQKLTAKRDYAMLSLFLGTGIRVSECVGINLSDINMEENAFLVTRKGGNQVVLYFPAEVATALGEYLEERTKIDTLPGHEDALFLSLQKRRITQRAVQNLVKKYAMVAAPLKPKISPHKLRSTFATNLYNATGDIYLVADVLGHSSVDTTRKHYADMTDARRRMAAEYVRLPGTEADTGEASDMSFSNQPDKPVT